MQNASRDIADSGLVRRMNAGRALTALRREPAMSTGDLVTATGMSRPTVHAAAQYLTELGWVTETTGTAPGETPRRGRPSRVFAFDASAGHVLGVDIGAHTARTALADLRGDVTAARRSAFTDPDLPAGDRIDRVRELAAATVRDAGLRPGEVLSVCVGTSGTISPDGVVSTRTGIPGFLGADLRTAFAQDFGPDVLVENDCNLAVIAERWRGLAADTSDVVCMLAGERLGVGVLVGGTLLRGHRNKARDLGFLHHVPDSTPDMGIASLARQCGRRLVEASAARAERGEPVDEAAPGAVLYAMVDGDPDRVDAQTVLRAVRAGDAAAQAVLQEALGSAARATAVLAMLFAPELVVLSGAVADAGDVLLEPLRRQVAEWAPEVPRLAASPLSERAVVTGAVRLALDDAETRYLDALAPAPVHAPRTAPA